MNAPALLTVKDAARLLFLPEGSKGAPTATHIAYVRALMADRQIAWRKVGRRYFIIGASLENLTGHNPRGYSPPVEPPGRIRPKGSGGSVW